MIISCRIVSKKNDLRSAIVKEACVLLEKLSDAAGNTLAALMRDMLNVLLQLLANGNSVRQQWERSEAAVVGQCETVRQRGGGADE